MTAQTTQKPAENKTPSEAEQKAANKAKAQQIERMEAMQADEDAAAKAKAEQPPAPAKEKAPEVFQAQPRDRMDIASAFGAHVVKCPGKVTPEIALGERYLWSIHTKFKRGDRVLFRHETFAWEVEATVIKINTELQTVRVSPLYKPVFHKLTDDKVDLDNLTVEHKGAAHKWVVMLGTSRIKTNFETQEEAEQWIARKKLGA